MTTAHRETLWHMRQHLSNSAYNVNVVVHRHADDSIFESVKLNLFFFHDALGLLGVSWENLALEQNWFHINSVEFTIMRKLCKHFNSVHPKLYRLWVFSNSASRTKNNL